MTCGTQVRPLPLVLLLQALALSGCALFERGPTTADAAAQETQVVAAQAAHQAEIAHEQAHIADLLQRGEAALDADHLSYPEAGSAETLFAEVLTLDPDNARARRGREQIVERHIAAAMDALERRQFASARSMLSRARLVDPNHPSIEPTAAQLRLLSEADRTTVRIANETLAKRDESLRSTLAGVGARATGSGCRAIITARNDVDGRWIYKALRAAGGDSRIRGTIEIGAPARVEVLCPGSSGR